MHSGPPEQLNRHDLEAVIDKVKPKVLQQCRDVEQFAGFLTVKLTIEKNGSVRSIQVQPPVDKTRTADCVTWARRTIERYPGHLPPYYALVAAAALQGDSVTASEALTVLLQLRPDLSLTWASQNMAPSGDVLDRLLEGLRRAGVPEK